MAWSQYESKDRMISALQQMFPALTERKLNDVARLTETYHNYKREYVKHLSFDLYNANHSGGLKYSSIFIYVHRLKKGFFIHSLLDNKL